MLKTTEEEIIAQLLLRTYDKCFVRGQVPPAVGSSIAHYDMFLKEELRTLITTLRRETEEAVAEARREERERIKKEIMQQTMLNDGSDTFVKLGEALWVCDSIEDRITFMKALTPPNTK